LHWWWLAQVFSGAPQVKVVGSVNATLWMPDVAPIYLDDPTYTSRLQRDTASAAYVVAQDPRSWAMVHRVAAAPSPQPGITVRFAVQFAPVTTTLSYVDVTRVPAAEAFHAQVPTQTPPLAFFKMKREF
jgi:hypothetical protein